MKTYPQASFPLEARRLLVGLSVIVLVFWYAILYTYGGRFLLRGDWSPYILPAFWTVLTVIFVADRMCRFRLLYEGALGSVAYYFVHDIPFVLGLRAPLGESDLAHCGVLLLTGIFASLPFGARGAGVSAVSGALLCGLWFLYGLDDRVVDLGHFATDTLMRGFFVILMGGLIAEKMSRPIRKHGEQGHAHPLLWVVVTLVTLWKLWVAV